MNTSLEGLVGVLARRVAALERQVIALSTPRGAPFALSRTTMPVNDTGVVQIVQAQLDPLSVRHAVPVLYSYGFTASPPLDADLHVSYIDGSRWKAVVTASGHQTYRLKNLSVGDSALYDIRGAYVWLTSAGPSINGAGNPTLITGDLHVTGAIYAGYGGADQVGVQTHTHKQGNDGHGDTEVPTDAPTAGT